MATLTNQNLTLLDLAKRTDPDGTHADVIEILNEDNEILQDIVFTQGNLDTGHRTTIRTGLPEPTWRVIGKGVQPTKTKTAQIDFTTGMLENFSEVDVELLKLQKDAAMFRNREDAGIAQGMLHKIAETLFYGNEDINTEEFTGLSYYYSDTSADSGDNIIDGGGTGSDNASIWLVGWSDKTIHGIVPKNAQAGLEIMDLGDRVSEEAGGAGTRLHVMTSKLHMKAGLAVEDWRYGVRIANIDRSELSGDISTGADLADLMFSALERLPSTQGVRPVFYMDRKLREILRKQLSAKTAQSTLETRDVGGTRTSMFNGDFPVRVVDALAVDEAQVT